MLSFPLALGCGGQEKVNFKEGQRFLAVDFNSDGTILAGISKTGAIILWDAIKQAKIKTLESKDRKASSLDFNTDGSLLAVGQDGGQVQILSMPDGEEKQTPRANLTAARKHFASYRKSLAFIRITFDIPTVAAYDIDGRYADFSFEGIIKLFFVSEADNLENLGKTPVALGQFPFGSLNTSTANLSCHRPIRHFTKIVLQCASLRANCFGKIFLRSDSPLYCIGSK